MPIRPAMRSLYFSFRVRIVPEVLRVTTLQGTPTTEFTDWSTLIAASLSVCGTLRMPKSPSKTVIRNELESGVPLDAEMSASRKSLRVTFVPPSMLKAMYRHLSPRSSLDMCALSG